MIKWTIIALFSILSLNSIHSQNQKRYSNTELIVQFKEDASVQLKNCLSTKKFYNEELDLFNKRLKVKDVRLTGNKKRKNTYILKFEENQNIEALISTYKNMGLFNYVEPNFIGKIEGNAKQTIPNDEFFSRQWGLLNDGSFSISGETINVTTNADVDMDLAWDIEQGNSSIIVAVLDSGAKLDHPDFNGRIWQNPNDNLDGMDNDNNNYVDDFRGWDFANNDNDPTDDHGHGTNVMGILGATGNNNIGYSGTDPNCTLMVLKILDNNNSGFYSWWIDAIVYAVDHGARVINLSVGGTDVSQALEDAVDYAFNNGVTVFASMGNQNSNVTTFPAAYPSSIAVGATNPDDTRAVPFFWNPDSGSNFANYIDVVAPGNYMYGLNNQSNTNYNFYWGGTSQATPLVSGIASLLLAQDPSRTPDDIRNILRDTADDQVGDSSEDVEGFDQYYGFGRVNAHKALEQFILNTDEFVKADTQITIHPNPVSDNLYIEGLNNIDTIIISNMIGQVFYKEKLNEQEFVQVNTQNIPSGIYFVNVQSENHSNTFTRKIVIN